MSVITPESIAVLRRDEYEPICWKCHDHGWVLCPYGEGGAGTKRCDICEGQYIKRRREALEGQR